MYKKALIITGGSLDIDFARKYICDKQYDIIIAVDGGLAYARSLFLKPDYIVGDFDTISHEVLKKYENVPGITIVKYNPEKDDTDTEAALNQVIKLECTDVDILGGMGSRFDHTISNMFILLKAHMNNINAYIIDSINRISIITGETKIKKSEQYGYYISLVPFDGSAYGITLTGLKYPLNNFDFDTEKTFRLGISNEIIDEEATITVRDGKLLLIESKKDA